MALKTFKQGIHPPEEKDISRGNDIQILNHPKEVFIPLQQHIGIIASPLVERGDLVKTGQLIAASPEFVSASIHASITGKVKTVDNFRLPSGIKGKMIHIIAGENEEIETLEHPKDWRKSEIKELLHVIRNAGLVGLGGAAFPTHVKLQPPKDKIIDTLILNGCECEPFLTADHVAMLNQGDALLEGCEILMKILNVNKAIIGIENNKIDAIEHLKLLNTNSNIEILPLQVKYPQGAEKMLIDAVLGRKVAPGKLPMDSGVVVQNVGTAIAVKEAIYDGKALIERIVTVSGNAFSNPGNYRVKLGTPVSVLLEATGYMAHSENYLFMGGPMMGKAITDTSVPIVKATSGLVAIEKHRMKDAVEYPCIQCAACVSACPMFLLPTQIISFAKAKDWHKSEELGVLSCMECGSCVYACPSNIPLVQWIKIAKYKVIEQKRKQVS